MAMFRPQQCSMAFGFSMAISSRYSRRWLSIGNGFLCSLEAKFRRIKTSLL